MKHFHGTPLGGSRQDVARFLIGRHALVPFLRQDDLGPVAEFCQSFILDNSAFTAWKAGSVIDMSGYAAWVAQWAQHPGFEWALIPDVIDGTEAQNDALLSAWPPGLRRHGVPVWHLHESLGRLHALCTDWPTVALGSSGQWRIPGTAAWWDRMSGAMAHVCDEQGRPAAHLHGLRMLDPAIFTRLPLASADSTNAGRNSGNLYRFGQYLPPSTWQRTAVIADRIEACNSCAVWARHPLQQELFK